MQNYMYMKTLRTVVSRTKALSLVFHCLNLTAQPQGTEREMGWREREREKDHTMCKPVSIECVDRLTIYVPRTASTSSFSLTSASCSDFFDFFIKISFDILLRCPSSLTQQHNVSNTGNEDDDDDDISDCIYILVLKKVEMYRVLWFHTHCEFVNNNVCVHVRLQHKMYLIVETKKKMMMMTFQIVYIYSCCGKRLRLE
jgi:hypothetical protein